MSHPDKLQQYLLEYYKASTFNTCEHQTLPLMDCPPLKLMVDPNAAPVAHHTPVPVPIHWREAVKNGLVRLGAGPEQDDDAHLSHPRAAPRA